MMLCLERRHGLHGDTEEEVEKEREKERAKHEKTRGKPKRGL